jgi:hypothetical protein
MVRLAGGQSQSRKYHDSRHRRAVVGHRFLRHRIRHQRIKREVTDKLKESFGISPTAVDGSDHTEWQVLDFFDVIVHIMTPDARKMYDLEGLWKDAPRVAPRKPAAPKKKTASEVKAVSKK